MSWWRRHCLVPECTITMMQATMCVNTQHHESSAPSTTKRHSNNLVPREQRCKDMPNNFWIHTTVIFSHCLLRSPIIVEVLCNSIQILFCERLGCSMRALDCTNNLWCLPWPSMQYLLKYFFATQVWPEKTRIKRSSSFAMVDCFNGVQWTCAITGNLSYYAFDVPTLNPPESPPIWSCQPPAAAC